MTARNDRRYGKIETIDRPRPALATPNRSLTDSPSASREAADAYYRTIIPPTSIYVHDTQICCRARRASGDFVVPALREGTTMPTK